MAKAKGSEIDVGHSWKMPKRLPDPPKSGKFDYRWADKKNVDYRKSQGYERVADDPKVTKTAYGHVLMRIPKEKRQENIQALRMRNLKRSGLMQKQALAGANGGVKGKQAVVRDGKTILED